MMLGRIFDIAAALVVVAGVVAVAVSPETKGEINAIVGGFVQSLQAATLRPTTYRAA